MIKRAKRYLNDKGIEAKDIIQAAFALGLITAVAIIMIYGLIGSLLGT